MWFEIGKGTAIIIVVLLMVWSEYKGIK